MDRTKIAPLFFETSSAIASCFIALCIAFSDFAPYTLSFFGQAQAATATERFLQSVSSSNGVLLFIIGTHMMIAITIQTLRIWRRGADALTAPSNGTG